MVLALLQWALAAYPVKPPVVLVVVVDQLRADQLAHLKPGGAFGRLKAQGAYYPQAEYEIAASMTCPGHATILTGAYPRSHGIAFNAWYDRAADREVYCVADPEHGVSPRNISGTTVGDELKTARKGARVFSFSVKDRSAIGLGGRAADGVFWFDDKKGGFVTSTFYSQETRPAWLVSLGQELVQGGLGSRSSMGSLTAVSGLTRAVLAGIRHFNIGSRTHSKGETELLAVSYSSHDYLGHAKGPQAPEMAPHLQAIEREVGQILAALPKDTLVVLTSDHGVAHAPDELASLRIQGGTFKAKALESDLEQRLGEKLGAGPYVAAVIGQGVYLRAKFAEDARVGEAVREVLGSPPWSEHFSGAVLASDLRVGRFPEGLLGRQLRNTFGATFPDVLGILRPYHFEIGSDRVNHMTGYAYDRTVPVLMAGPGISRGVFSGGHVVDIAPTLSFLLGIVPPALSEGSVLKEAVQKP